MNHVQKSKARLFFTYLKDKTELFLYVKPHGTSGSEMTYRRAPGDAAMNLRIQAILNHAKVHNSDTEIWILLYPPEIYTTTMYIPSQASNSEVKALIHEQIFSTLSYPINYDWENYHITVHENGHNENMVTVTILGKDVLPRIQDLLDDNYDRVRFVGDGLQFLNIESTFFQQLRGQTYKMILPYDEMYYTAAFRSGLHVESSVLTHACSSSFGDYELNQQQVYLDIRQKKNLIHQPGIQPVVPCSEWKSAHLTSAAFPTWFIARNSLHQGEKVNFVRQSPDTEELSERKRSIKKFEAIHLLD
ncbi:MAG: hypothetical protein HQ556_00395 [Candidatus Marinimicrobia bacterium]|nr:hypothetical protein [Candidatus Neomarinimicrobiota bacterium]